MKRRWKILWWTVAGLVVLIVTAAIVGPTEEETTRSRPATTAPSTERPSTTKPKPATTQKRTTITTRKPATTTTTSSVSKAECDRWLNSLLGNSRTLEEYFERIAVAANNYDLVSLQTVYTQIDGMMPGVTFVADVFLDECEHRYPSDEMTTVRSTMSTVKSSWADIQRVCRNDLAAFGFEC